MRHRPHARAILMLFAATLSACGREGTPTGPTAARSFLEGTWTGTLTIEREDEPTTSGATTWTFEVVAGTNLQTFNVRIQSQHPFLPDHDHRHQRRSRHPTRRQPASARRGTTRRRAVAPAVSSASATRIRERSMPISLVLTAQVCRIRRFADVCS